MLFFHTRKEPGRVFLSLGPLPVWPFTLEDPLTEMMSWGLCGVLQRVLAQLGWEWFHPPLASVRQAELPGTLRFHLGYQL